MSYDISNVNVSALLNNAFNAKGLVWPAVKEDMQQFIRDIEQESGLQIKIVEASDPTGRYQYRIDRTQVRNPKLFTLFQIKYSSWK